MLFFLGSPFTLIAPPRKPSIQPTQKPMWILLQRLMPALTITRLLGWLARKQGGNLTHTAIRWFIGRYAVDMSEAADPNPASYSTFNDFFTRALKAGLRPIADAAWVSPVDGTISQCGSIERDQIFQAKGKHFTTQALLACSAEEAAAFDNGQFATIYLSPRDYHRIHMPCDGVLRKMVYVPGTLYSVNPQTAAGIDALFAKNERVVCWFDTPHGSMTLTLVGATIVGSMATVWHGTINALRAPKVTEWQYPAAGEKSIHLKKGDEMGRFMLGSTVVLTWPVSARLAFESEWQAQAPVKMGQAMGHIAG